MPGGSGAACTVVCFADMVDARHSRGARAYNRGVKTTAALMLAMLAAASHARDGESMAPGKARLQTLEASGAITVTVLERAFHGAWLAAGDVSETPLLASHWQGSAKALAQRPLGVALLHGADGTRMRCEFVNDPDRLAGVCEEIGSRLYYLSR